MVFFTQTRTLKTYGRTACALRSYIVCMQQIYAPVNDFLVASMNTFVFMSAHGSVPACACACVREVAYV